jgi:hypothetical protein
MRGSKPGICRPDGFLMSKTAHKPIVLPRQNNDVTTAQIKVQRISHCEALRVVAFAVAEQALEEF